MPPKMTAKTIVPLFLTLFTFVAIRSTTAAPPTQVPVAVQEDWKMVLKGAEPGKVSPQFCTGYALNNSLLFQVCWNYRDQPAFAAGGVQLQAWNDTALVDSTSVTENPMSVDNDVITWTQVVTSKQGNTELKIVGINSQTWGSNINTAAVAIPINTPNFSNYDVQLSLTNSGITYGRNRVVWFGIVETRLLDDKGKVITRDTTPRAVFP